MSEKFQIHRKIIERDKIHTPNTQIYFHPIFLQLVQALVQIRLMGQTPS